MDNENIPDTLDNPSSEAVASPPAAPPSNLPLIITLVALVIYFGFQTLALLSERANLGQVKANQEAGLKEAGKIQSQFRTIVAKTGELAEKGHTGAKMVMEGLQRQGMGAGMAGPAVAPRSPDNAPAKLDAKSVK